jgi:lipopolysaccharide transport system ATP-binding protein
MAGDVVIRAEGLGKKYVIGHEAERERYTALRDVIARNARGLWRKTADLAHGRAIVGGDTTEEFWALKDVSFEVRRGEVLGIIGRNGAGKSTLLKILSRITEPTEGRVEIRGRVASLLEVGTGFHPELTGRENIYLNGAILGMTRAEIRRKFDEIVAFAEVEKFLDTPVKRYSSGMYVRLAFAVAAHLEPEILVVDEVLAVGDAEFQKKCLGKMQDVAGHGRTVLFVSHNMGAVRQLCQRGVVMRSGATVYDGEIDGAVSAHLSNAAGTAGSQTEWTWTGNDAPGGAEVRLRRVAISGEKSPGPAFQPDEEIKVVFNYDLNRPVRNIEFVLRVLAGGGEVAFATTDHAARKGQHLAGQYEARCTIPANLLNRTAYTLVLSAGVRGQLALLPMMDVGRFYIEGIGNEGHTSSVPNWPGLVCPKIEWEVNRRSIA